MSIDYDSPRHPVHEIKSHLPFRLKEFICAACDYLGWVPEFIFSFKCSNCGADLIRREGGI